MVEYQFPKLMIWVQFPLSAPQAFNNACLMGVIPMLFANMYCVPVALIQVVRCESIQL